MKERIERYSDGGEASATLRAMVAARKIEMLYAGPTIIPVDIRRACATVVMWYTRRRGSDGGKLEPRVRTQLKGVLCERVSESEREHRRKWARRQGEEDANSARIDVKGEIPEILTSPLGRQTTSTAATVAHPIPRRTLDSDLRQVLASITRRTIR